MSDEPKFPRCAKCFIIPQRVIMSIMTFFAIVNAYTMRLAISMVITKLVVEKNITHDTTKDDYVCPPDINVHELEYEGEHEWSQTVQGFIFGAFYIGYVITHIPGGIAADELGGKWVLSLGILSTAIFTIVSPITIDIWGSTGLIILRFLMGVGEGTTFPAISVLISHWVPLSERGKLGAFVLGGGQVGTIFNNLSAGFMLHSFDWPYVFYMFGAVAILWFIIFTCICYSTPAEHPCIKQKEKDFLTAELHHLNNRKDLPPPPMREIFTSKPVYALVFGQIGHDWGFYVMITYLPKYFNDVLQMSIKKNGFYSALPYVLMWIVSILSGFLGDWIIAHDKMSLTNLRRMMTSCAAVLPAFFMLGASYAGCNKTLVIIMFTCCMASMGPWYCGMKLAPFDMSPNYAGTIMGIANGLGAITGFIAPSVVGYMTPNATIMEWRKVFWLAFTILNLSAITYCMWASSEIQDFNEPKEKRAAA